MYYLKYVMSPTFAALNNPQYNVLPHLIHMAHEENIKLQQMRYRKICILNYYHMTFLGSDIWLWNLSDILNSFSYSEEFEAANNTVELHLHLAPNYRLANGALQPISNEQKGSTTLRFDRRKTVGELRLAIYQVTSFPETLAVVFLECWKNG